MIRLTIGVWLLLASVALAQDGYRTAIDRALEEYELGNFAEARAQFLHAHQISPNARSYRGLGMAEFELRNYGAAIEHLESALACEERALDDILRKQTQELLVRTRAYVAQVSLQVSPAHASLRVDGVLEEARTLTLQVGDHTLDLRAPGYLEEKRVLKVNGGEQLSLDLALRARQDEEHVARRWFKSPWLWGATAIVLGGVTAALLLTRDPGTRLGPPEGGTRDVRLMGPP